jgi:antitoxin CptB
MDLIMGRFADAEIGTLTEAELDAFEALIEVPDRDLFRWITGEDPTPANYDTPVFRRLKAFTPTRRRSTPDRPAPALPSLTISDP